MKFTQCKTIKEIWIYETSTYLDHRGSWERYFDQDSIFKNTGIDFQLKQAAFSKNNKKNTIRGLHYQIAPYQECKIVSCTKGKILDVIIDIRPNSPTYLKQVCIELSEFDCKYIIIPKGFAHGFQTLKDNSIIHYYIDENFNEDHSRGIYFKDPTINIRWKQFKSEPVLSKRDKNFSTIKNI